MASLNKVALIGYVGSAPEFRHLPNGTPVSNFSLATSMKRKDEQTGEYVDTAEWHRLVCYERQAEIARDYVRKGAPLYVEGRIRYRKYVDKNGIERYMTEIVVSHFQLLSSKKDADDGFDQPRSRSQRPAPIDPAPDTEIPF